jgi:tetratricopeptide (TPR) repeat protein
VRITTQLIDAATGGHIWAERHDRGLSDIFAIQDEIVDRVAGSIEPELLKSESDRAPPRPPAESMTGWDLVRQGMWHFHQVSRETHHKAHALFRAAAKANPRLPEAHIWLSRVCAGVVPYGWSDDPDADLREGRRAALTAIELDEKNPYSHFGLAINSVYSGALDEAKRAAEQAVELSPSFALGHFVLGMARLFSGDATGAIPPLQRGLRLSPYDPQNFVWYGLLAAAHLFARAPQEAVEAATRALGFRPDWRPTLEMAAICLAAAGRSDEARRYAEQGREVPAQPGDVLKPLRVRNPQWADQMRTLLREAETGL